MALLLKLNREAIADNVAIVAAMKSAKLSEADLGSLVYVWFDDTNQERSGLASKAHLAAYEAVYIPQVRDPSKRKHAFRLVLEPLPDPVARPLATDDLAPFRYSEDTGGIESLGRIHRDRNDKIIRLSQGQADALAARFDA